MYSSKPKMPTREMSSNNNIVIELESEREKLIPQRKLNFANKLESLLDEYHTCLIIEITNIGSKQIAEMRKEFRGTARFLFGKNTLIRKIIRDYVKKTGKKNKNLMKLMDLIKGNCGLVFTKKEIKPIREKIIKNSIKQSSAKYGSIAPCDVYLDIGPTNMEPTKTQIFQSMDIETRINKGQIDIITPKHLIKKGEKVGASEALLLSQLNIKPFYYGINVLSIYDKGEIIKDCSFMDMNINDITNSFYNGLNIISAFCLHLKYPTILNVPHSILNAYKSVIALSMNFNQYTFKELQDIQYALQKQAQDMKDNDENNDNPLINRGGNDDDDDDDDDSSSSQGGGGIFDPSSSDESSSSDDDEMEQANDGRDKEKIKTGGGGIFDDANSSDESSSDGN